MADRLDPMIAGLLEGAAFLAARVQLKLKHEFADFTTNLLDQLAPHYLAPTPSFLLAQVQPKFGDPALREGRVIARGAYFDAAYRELERNIACRFKLTAPITLWPFEIARAEYFTSAGPLQALGLPLGGESAAGLRLQLSVRAAARLEDEPADKEAEKRPELRFSACRVKDLRVHLLGQEADAIALYEQAFAHCRGVYFRFLDAFGDPVVVKGGDDYAAPDRFRRGRGACSPTTSACFAVSISCATISCFRAASSASISSGSARSRRASPPRRSTSSSPSTKSILASPPRCARNSSHSTRRPPSTCSKRRSIASRSNPTSTNTPSCPTAAARSTSNRTASSTFSPIFPASRRRSRSNRSIRRPPRAAPRGCATPSAACRAGARSKSASTGRSRITPAPTCSCRWASAPIPKRSTRVAELSVQALCTNRHLTEHLPVGEGGADFRFLDDVDLEVRCIAGPTRPREPTMTAMVGKTRRILDRRRRLAHRQHAQPQPSRPRRARGGRGREIAARDSRPLRRRFRQPPPSARSGACAASTRGRSFGVSASPRAPRRRAAWRSR